MTIAAILASPGDTKALEHLCAGALDTSSKAALAWLHPDARKKAAKAAIRLFVEQWVPELEATAELAAAVEPLRQQLKRLVESCAREISEWMDPEVRSVDLSLLAHTWAEMKLNPLPADFDWNRVASNYLREIKRYFRNDPSLNAAYSVALQERQTRAAELASGLAPGFDLEGYRRFLIEKKCNFLNLAVMDTCP